MDGRTNKAIIASVVTVRTPEDEKLRQEYIEGDQNRPVIGDVERAMHISIWGIDPLGIIAEWDKNKSEGTQSS